MFCGTTGLVPSAVDLLLQLVDLVPKVGAVGALAFDGLFQLAHLEKNVGKQANGWCAENNDLNLVYGHLAALHAPKAAAATVAN